MTRTHVLRLIGAAFVCCVLFPGSVAAQDLPKIVVAGPAIDDLKTVHYGIRSGIFRKYGVDVEIVTVANGAAALVAPGQWYLSTTDPEWLDPKWLQSVIDVAFKHKPIDRTFPAGELLSSVLLGAPS